MPVVSASIDSFIVTAIVVSIPTCILLNRRQAQSQSPYRAWLTLLVTLHTVYIVYILTVQWPPNLFQRLHIPLTMPSTGIRSILLQRADLPPDAHLPKPLEGLLTKLSSFDTRIAYVRFGQTVLQDCQYCKSLDQYALYALPAPLAQYIREAALIGLLTAAPTHRARWRTHAIVALVALCLLEGYFAASAPIHIPRNGKNVFMLHDTLWLLRHLTFLLLPILTHSLPATPPPDPLAAILSTRAGLEHALRRLTYAKLLHGAVLREPSLRSAAASWWDAQRRDGEAVREDEGVRGVAEKVGVGFVVGGTSSGDADGKAGKLLLRVREAAVQLKSTALVPPVPGAPLQHSAR